MRVTKYKVEDYLKSAEDVTALLRYAAELEIENERLTKERDEWKEKWMAMWQAALTAGLLPKE